MIEKKPDFEVHDRRVKEDVEAPKAEATEPKQEAGSTCGCSQAHQLPKVSMATLILSLSSSAMVHMGEVPEPESGRVCTELALAKHTIDILGLLEEKTKGNLSPEEERLFKDVLYELRMIFVQKKP